MISKYCFTLLLGVFFTSSSFAQLIINKSGEEIKDQILFNKEYIKRNNIKTITGNYLLKKDHQALIDFGTKSKYQFDKKGNLTFELKIENIAQKWDTTEISYTYDSYNNLIERKSKRKTGYWIQEYKYDSENKNAIELSNYLEGANPDGKRKTQQNNQNFTWKEINDSTFQKSISNNFGQPYLKTTYYYNNSRHYLLKETHHYIVTNEKQEIIYFYNKMGWLEKTETPKKNYQYKYDELGNLIEIKTFQNSNETRMTEYLYKNNGTLEAEIKTTEKNSNIHIIKYNIEYY